MTESLAGNYPPIVDLVDPAWTQHSERLILHSLDKVIEKSNALGPKTPISFPARSLERLSEGLLLDVGCGNIFGRGSTLVDLLPNAYGIDPALYNPKKYLSMGDVPRERVMAGYAEDLPFRDQTFRSTISLKCVGWYSDVTVNSFWAINEMVRVTENGGLITIIVGQNKDKNTQIILKAAEQVKSGPLGRRIEQVKDFTQADGSQISIRLL